MLSVSSWEQPGLNNCSSGRQRSRDGYFLHPAGIMRSDAVSTSTRSMLRVLLSSDVGHKTTRLFPDFVPGLGV